MLILKQDEKRSAARTARARTVAALAARFPSLEAAIRSRNNSDFRTAIAEVARAAASLEAAVTLLETIQAENLSAFLQFCGDVFEGVERTSRAAPATGISLAKLLGESDDSSEATDSE